MRGAKLSAVKRSALNWLILAVLLRAVSQVLMKLLALDVDASSPGSDELLIALVIALTLIIRALSWHRALTHFPLSFVYPFSAIALIALIVAGHLLFDERIAPHSFFSITLIAIGILFLARANIKEQL